MIARLQNSPYFCVFKYARAVKQKVWNEAENLERDLRRERVFFSRFRACEARARKTLTACFIDLFTDFEKKTDCFAVYMIAKQESFDLLSPLLINSYEKYMEISVDNLHVGVKMAKNGIGAREGGGGGHLGIFWVGRCRPGLQIGTPF